MYQLTDIDGLAIDWRVYEDFGAAELAARNYRRLHPGDTVIITALAA